VLDASSARDLKLELEFELIFAPGLLNWHPELAHSAAPFASLPFILLSSPQPMYALANYTMSFSELIAA
jgi:hypothetical protein